MLRLPSPVERALALGEDDILEWLQPDKRLLQTQDLPEAYFDTGAFMFMSPAHLESAGFKAFETMLPLVLPLYKIADTNEPEDLELAEVLYLGRQARVAAT